MNHWALRSEAFHQGWQNERKKHRKIIKGVKELDPKDSFRCQDSKRILEDLYIWFLLDKGNSLFLLKMEFITFVSTLRSTT